MNSAGLVLGGMGYPTAVKCGSASAAAPRNATLPPDSSMTRSKPLYTAEEGWWMVHTMAMLAATASSLRKRMMLAAAAASSPDVGSSRKSTRGLESSAMARLRRRFWPPDNPAKKGLPTLVLAQPIRPMVCSTASTRSAFSAAGRLRYKSAANATVSRHVRNAQCLSCCGTVAQYLVKISCVMSSPFKRTSPTESPFLLSSVRRSMRHVLPAPDGPIIASTSPELTEPLMPLRISLTPPLVLTLKRTSLNTNWLSETLLADSSSRAVVEPRPRLIGLPETLPPPSTSTSTTAVVKSLPDMMMLLLLSLAAG
mmetsp:Transcript_19708/g.49409  ORF Transcript_19708/g.49409 Transcript_19708/m.49409 type:complete len:311 (+) Transcript_19708:1321-2253(+)